MAGSAKRKQAMLPTLQRFDASIVEVLEMGGHVSMYAFAADRLAWVRRALSAFARCARPARARVVDRRPRTPPPPAPAK
jgi:hypothetical protein